MSQTDALYERIYEVARQVPHGMVATYGDLAAIVGGDCDARTVGYALNEIPKALQNEIPWQRIINSSGGTSTRGHLQRRLLEGEGIAFDARDRIDLARFRWGGPSADWADAHGFKTLAPRDDSPQLRLF